MNIRRLLLLSVLLPATVLAQDERSKKDPSLVVKGVLWVKTLIDSMAVATVDRNYIEQPKKPWSVELRTTAGQATQTMVCNWDMLQLKLSSRTDNGFSTSAGLWLGYRGYGFGLSKELTGGDGSSLTFGAMGGSFGINLRINSYRSKSPEIEITSFEEGTQAYESSVADLDDPIRVRSLFLDGYYMFNGKRFSYAAAYDQSLIQRRSAGSLMAGAMYYHTSVDYSDDANWILTFFMRGVGKQKFTQANVGIGYAYNWVPARGWLVSAMAMPMLTLYNRSKLYYYEIEHIRDPNTDNADLSDESSELFYVHEAQVMKTPNHLTWNYDARLSVVYNWRDVYLRVFGHYNRFEYGKDFNTGRLTDWTAYASVGFRF